MGKKKTRRTRQIEPERRIIQPPKKQILLPSDIILRPPSPFLRRVSSLPLRIPPPESPAGRRLKKMMEMDVGFQLKLKEFERRLSYIVNARVNGGSGLQISKLLRLYFVEYLDRLMKHGPDSFPTSFNIIEAFLSFNRQNMFFDLRDEIEHILSVGDYFRWYERNELPREPRFLTDIMTDGTIYSYEMVREAGGPQISGDSEQMLAAAGLVRHGYELSCVLLAGEKPPRDSDEMVAQGSFVTGTHGREWLAPAPEWKIEDRYLDGHAGFARVILLTRFDLRDGKHDVRYVNLDCGQSYTVLTDDPSVFPPLSSEDLLRYKKVALDGLERYDAMFSALASMIFLPAFFAAYPERVQGLNVAIGLLASKEEKKVKQIIGEIGQSQCVMERVIHCMPVSAWSNEEGENEIRPPEMHFKSDGYWKAIGPLEFGEDMVGNAIAGRTWVARHETWSARSPRAFLLQATASKVCGPDPGAVYIQRCPAHAESVYNVGLTRRAPETRARELSGETGVPLPFGVLASWEVGDCSRVEQEVHRRLAAFRIDPRREFFSVGLATITKTVDAVIRELSAQ